METAARRAALLKVAAYGLAAVLALTGCASAGGARLEPLPSRQADLYPVAQAREGVTVAVDALANPVRAQRHFGTDLRAEGILPVQVIVSNHGTRRLAIGPADVLLVRDRTVIDPLPLATVIDAITRRGAVRGSEREIGEHVARSALQEAGIAPGATVRGLLYFPIPEIEAARRGHWSFSGLVAYEGLELRVALTDAETSERLRFGPLPVVLR